MEQPKPGAEVEWFRRTTWTKEDQEDFFGHLSRSRTQAPQYVRIQALYLEKTGSRPLVRAALELLDLWFSRYPEETGQRALALLQRARCLAALGRDAEALDEYRRVLETMRVFRGVQVPVTDYARFVIQRKLVTEYQPALSALNEFQQHMLLPVEMYERRACQALIEERLGLRAEARTHARAALRAAGQTETGLRYHKYLGLVGDLPAKERRKLTNLAI